MVHEVRTGFASLTHSSSGSNGGVDVSFASFDAYKSLARVMMCSHSSLQSLVSNSSVNSKRLVSDCFCQGKKDNKCKILDSKFSCHIPKPILIMP